MRACQWCESLVMEYELDDWFMCRVCRSVRAEASRREQLTNLQYDREELFNTITTHHHAQASF